MRKLMTITFVFILICGSCLTFFTSESILGSAGTVFGRVTDINGTPIARAWVRLGIPPLYAVNWTNVTGYYFFDNVSYGNYEINVRKRGYEREEVFDLTLSEQKPTIQLDVKLSKTPEEEPEICLPAYGFVIFILIIFFGYLFFKVRKVKRGEPENDEELAEGYILNEDVNMPSETEEPKEPPPSP